MKYLTSRVRAYWPKSSGTRPATIAAFMNLGDASDFAQRARDSRWGQATRFEVFVGKTLMSRLDVPEVTP